MIRRGQKRRGGLANSVATRLLRCVVAKAIELPYLQRESSDMFNHVQFYYTMKKSFNIITSDS